MLIDDRIPPFEPSRRVWEPDPRTSAWVLAAVAAAAGSFATGGFASFVLLCAAIACASQAVARALPYGSGLRDYRQ